MAKLKIQFALALFLSTLTAVTVSAQEEKKQAKQAESSEQGKDEPKTLVQIRTAMMKEQSEVLKEYRSAKPGTPAQRDALNRYYAVADKYADQIISSVKEDPSDRVGTRMLTQLVQMT